MPVGGRNSAPVHRNKETRVRARELLKSAIITRSAPPPSMVTTSNISLLVCLSCIDHRVFLVYFFFFPLLSRSTGRCNCNVRTVTPGSATRLLTLRARTFERSFPRLKRRKWRVSVILHRCWWFQVNKV